MNKTKIWIFSILFLWEITTLDQRMSFLQMKKVHLNLLLLNSPLAFLAGCQENEVKTTLRGQKAKDLA